MARPSDPNRRSSILLAARDAFNARGFAGARMEDIARAVGISKAALYLQFGSKETLFEALTTELIEATLPDMVPAQFGEVPAEALLRGFIVTVAQRMSSPEVAFVPRVIIGEGMNFPDLARFYHNHVIDRGLGIIEAIIRHGIARGEMVCDDPPLACRTVIGGILIGAIWKMVFEPIGADPVDVDAAANIHADTILNGLIVRKEHA